VELKNLSIVTDRRSFLSALASLIATKPARLLRSAWAQSSEHGMSASVEQSQGVLRSLNNATAWLNTSPLTPETLRGKVVLVEFWTFTCINWLRTMPYVRAWSQKYKDHGLVVVGAHSPEFSFEHNLENVRRQTAALDVDFPVAVDSDFKIWRAFNNNYWPALYFVDSKGSVRHEYFGEGEYAASERKIQQLLIEADHKGFDRDLVTVVGKGAEAPADWNDLRTPETYVGMARGENLVSPRGASSGGGAHRYTVPSNVPLNHWALDGAWNVSDEKAASVAANTRIVFRFHARDLHFVMGPPSGAPSVRFRIRVDGQPPGDAKGMDVDAQGHGMASEQRLYQLVRQPRPITDRQFEIEFLDPGVEAFVFTFG